MWRALASTTLAVLALALSSFTCTETARFDRLGALSPARAQQTPLTGSTQTFVSCSIYRDTDQGRKSGCWLGDDPASGTRYDVTFAPNKPRRGYQILVEGVSTSSSTVTS